MNPGALPPLVCALIALSLGSFVLVKRPSSWINRSFTLLCLETFHWQASWFSSFFIHREAGKVLIVKIAYTLITFLPFTYYHFVALILRAWEKEKFRVWGFYFVGFIFFILTWQGNRFVAGYHQFGWGYYGKAGPLHPAYLIFFGLAISRIFLLLRRELKDPSIQGRRRTQVKFLFFAYLLFLMAGVEFLVNYGLGFYPIGVFFILASFGTTSYAITRYQLMEIEVIVKKTLVFAGVFSMVMGVVAVVTGVSQNYLARYFAINQALSTIVSVALAILLYDPTRSFLVRATDRFLFQKKVSIREILKELSERIITILDLDQVAKMILETFRDSLRAESGAILLKNESDYRILNSFGLVAKEARGVYPSQDPLLQHFRSHPEVTNLESEETYGKLPLPVSSALQKLAAVVAIPLMLHGELIGLLTLGKKKSDQEYTAEEIEYFPTVAGQVAIALSNARLYHESIEARKKIEQMQLELVHKEKMAFVADLVKGIAHEVFNPLLPVYYAVAELERDILVGLYKIYKAEGNQLAPGTREEYFKLLKQLNSVAETIKVNSEHIHLVIDTLNEMQKEEEETIGALDFKMFLKDSRALIGMELHGASHEVPIEEDVPRGLPPIKGNPTLLKQVFVNLFKNAIHAMEGKGERKITIKAETDPESKGFMKINFSDTGSGIPADTLPRIFDFGFTTKGKQGQGIGLSQCKLIIEKFGGSITCQSQAGRGTTFTLRLPLWEEKGAR